MSDRGNGIRGRAHDAADGGEPVGPVPAPTDDPITEYRVLIDALIGPSWGARWVRQNRWGDRPVADVVFRNRWDAEHADIVYGKGTRPKRD